jgi:phi13 family phage major tail protein
MPDSNVKVSFGFSSVYYAPYTPGAGGAPGTWEKPKPLPGAVGFGPSPQGQDYTFYADNGSYFKYTKDNGDAGDLELAYMPEEFLIDALGWAKDANGMLMELANVPQKPFALLFEVEGVNESGGREPIRVVYYNVVGAKPSRDFSTATNSVEVKTAKMALTCSPLDFGEDVGAMARASITKTGAPTLWDNFFKEVCAPGAEK